MSYDAIIIGAGAAGLMCAITAARRGKTVLVLERSKKAGAKIVISGGGRCNFTNQDTVPTAYLSANPHFAKSALSRFTPWDIMGLLGEHGATWHEKTLGQLFCDQGSGKVLQALLDECASAGAILKTRVEIEAVDMADDGYAVKTNSETYTCKSVVVACGGISIPKMGATDFGYKLARQFKIPVIEPKPALVPFTFAGDLVESMKGLSGVSADSVVSCGKTSFRENLLFTHRGLSGPAILQISSYWDHGDDILINLLPDMADVNLLPDMADVFGWLKEQRQAKAKTSLKTILGEFFADRLAENIAANWPGNMADMSNTTLQAIADRLSAWRIKPSGTEGFKKAEVTKGGVNTDYLSSKSMEAKKQPGLYFIGECVDVTGWLGGYNFQWAWASGFVAGESL